MKSLIFGLIAAVAGAGIWAADAPAPTAEALAGQQALAVAPTCNTAGARNPHNGFFEDPSRGTPTGAQAEITVRGSTPCTSSFTYNYVMLYERSSAANDWLQVGYRKNGIQPTTHSGQRNSNGSLYDWYGSHVYDGDVHTYRVHDTLSGSGAYALTAFVDGTAVMSYIDSDTNPHWSGGTYLEFSQEAYYLPSNVPGTPSRPATIANMTYFTPSGTSGYPVDCGLINYVNNNPSHWGHSFTSCDTQPLYTSQPY